MFILSVFVKVIEYVYTRVIGCVKPFEIKSILKQFCVGVKTLAWYIDPNGTNHKKIYIVKNHILLVSTIVKCYYRYLNNMKKNGYRCTLGSKCKVCQKKIEWG